MNKFERMDIVLKIDDAVQTMTEVVTSLQDQLSTEDFSFMEDGWQQNDGFNEDKTEKLIEITLTMQPLMNSIVNDWVGC